MRISEMEMSDFTLVEVRAGCSEVRGGVQLPSGEYCFQEVPEGAKMILEGDMPCGNWQLLGADPTRLTEEEAGEIVERYNDGGPFCRDYSCKTPVYGIAPSASLDSLAGSLGISKPFVILKLKDNDNT